MENATSINFERMQEDQRQRNFEYMAQSFFERWQPEDKREASQFSAELFSLVRNLYIDAQKPAMDELVKVLRCLPMVFPTVKP